jgi:hypothetical protein
LSYEGKEKADVLNKYFCSITNLVDKNKTLPDFDDRGGNVLENIWVRKEEIIDNMRQATCLKDEVLKFQ